MVSREVYSIRLLAYAVADTGATVIMSQRPSLVSLLLPTGSVYFLVSRIFTQAEFLLARGHDIRGGLFLIGLSACLCNVINDTYDRHESYLLRKVSSPFVTLEIENLPLVAAD